MEKLLASCLHLVFQIMYRLLLSSEHFMVASIKYIIEKKNVEILKMTQMGINKQLSICYQLGIFLSSFVFNINICCICAYNIFTVGVIFACPVDLLILY